MIILAYFDNYSNTWLICSRLLDKMPGSDLKALYKLNQDIIVENIKNALKRLNLITYWEKKMMYVVYNQNINDNVVAIGMYFKTFLSKKTLKLLNL